MAGSANTQAHHTQFGKRRVPRGGDTTREAQRAGLDGHWVASWEGSEGSREEGERERVAAGCRDVDRCAGWSAPGLRTSENTSGDVRANLGGHPAPRPPGDRRLHGWCRKPLNGKVDPA